MLARNQGNPESITLSKKIELQISKLEKNITDHPSDAESIFIWRQKIAALEAALDYLAGEEVDLEVIIKSHPYLSYQWDFFSGWQDSSSSYTAGLLDKARSISVAIVPANEISNVNMFQYPDISLQIFLMLDNSSILSFLLTSKQFSEFLQPENEIWKTITAHQMTKTQQNFFKKTDGNYKEFFIKRAAWEKNNLIKPSFFNTHIKTIGNKSVDFCKAFQYIREDKAQKLFNEVSELGELVPHIKNMDVKSGHPVIDKFDWMHHNGLGQEFESYRGNEIKFLLEFIPPIINANAENCFQLFTQGLSYIGLVFKEHNLRRGYFTGKSLYHYIFLDSLNKLAEIIFNSSNTYFKRKFINTIFHLHDLKLIINICKNNNILNILYKGLDSAPERLQIYISSISEIPQLLIDVGYPNAANSLHAAYSHLEEKSEFLKDILGADMKEGKLTAAMNTCNQLNETLASMLTIKNALDTIQIPENDLPQNRLTR